jgi:hypothetical protein
MMKQMFTRPADFSVAKMMSESFSAFETPKPSRVIIRLEPHSLCERIAAIARSMALQYSV